MVASAVKEINTLTSNELEILLKQKSDDCICVSIFMPVRQIGREKQQNTTRLKNLLREAERRLIDTGLTHSETTVFLAPASKLLEDAMFWQRQSSGLCVFLSDEDFRYYHVPLDFKELVVVGNRFHIKPILPLFSGDGRFYLLALSQKEIRLLQCSRNDAREIDLKGIAPGSLDMVMKENRIKRLETYHAGAPQAGKEGVVFHGQALSDSEKKNILRFFQRVAKGLQDEILKEEKAPLIIAAVDYLQPIYRKASSYKYIFNKSITGNPDLISSKVLQEQGWQIIQPFFDTGKMKAINEYKQLAGSGQTSNTIREIAANSFYGKIDVLFVAPGQEIWGTFNANTGIINGQESDRSCYVDLADFAAANTLLHRGTVYSLALEQMPDNSPVAAILRKT